MEKLLDMNTVTNQDALRQVEALCTQEDPPACAAACPLHVDVRTLAARAAAGDFAGAFKAHAKAVPFANLVAHTCAAPCQPVCKRAGLGGPVQIQLLERTAATEAGKPQKPPLMVPKKPQKAAVVGGGLRGMAAAGDLARKGYQVTLFEKTGALGGGLNALPEETLPPALLAAEIKALLALPLKVVYDTQVPVDDPEAAAAFLLKDFDAAYVACACPLDALANPDSLLVEGQAALLAGRRGGRLCDATVYDVYDGRSAATTMDRLFQQVSVEAGREKEGSQPSRLYTSLAGVAPVPGVPAGPAYSPQQAAQEAARCIQCECLECVKKCGFMQHYKASPSRYVREVYNNLSIAMGIHHANGMINTCALCSQCEAVCPNGLDMRQVFLAARQRMVHSGKMPPSAHEFALEDMDYSLSDAFYTLRHQPGHTKSAALFFPGCQLAASEPALVEAAYGDLCARMEGGVGLWLGCCGVLAHWGGEAQRFEAAGQKLKADWQAMGGPPVITACPTCTKTLNELVGIPARSLFAALEELGLPPGAPGVGQRAGAPKRMRLHHACGARYDEATKQQVGRLAAAAGLELLPAAAPDDQSPCCGYGGLVPFVDSQVAGRITDTALEQLGGAGQGEAPPVLTYCVNCRDRYLAKGRPAWHLLELAYPKAGDIKRKSPSWSQRQQNRAALKRRLLARHWGEHIEEARAMELYLSEELENKLEETHILHSDIEKTIARAEAENQKLQDPATGRFTASFRPANVTFWVEYSPEGAGYRVHNAWCHRMAAILTSKLTESGAAEA